MTIDYPHLDSPADACTTELGIARAAVRLGRPLGDRVLRHARMTGRL